MSNPPRTGFDFTESMRQQFVDRISDGYARDLLTETEFEERVEAANHASDLRQLRRLVADLPEGIRSAPTPATHDSAEYSPAHRPSYHPVYTNVEANDQVLCVFSGSERKGGTPALNTRSVAVFGGIDFDFRGATLQPGATYTIDCTAIFGGIDIIVPRGVNLDVRGMGVFGGFDGGSHRGDPEGPTIRVRGFALFGGVDIKVKD